MGCYVFTLLSSILKDAVNLSRNQPTALKWNVLGLGIKEDEMVDDGAECSNPNDCRSSERIVFVMELFDLYQIQCKLSDHKVKQRIDRIGSIVDESRDECQLYLDSLDSIS